jgi:hypothetical protein
MNDEKIKKLVDEILIFPATFLLIIVLYLWVVSIVYGFNSVIPSLNALLTEYYNLVFISSIILSTFFVFIDKKFLKNEKIDIDELEIYELKIFRFRINKEKKKKLAIKILLKSEVRIRC